MKFEQFLEKLKAAGLRVTVLKRGGGGITVQCGWNYPDSMFEEVDEIAMSVGFPNVDICAESAGGTFEKFVINGGHRRH
jgi:hypothetical protein